MTIQYMDDGFAPTWTADSKLQTRLEPSRLGRNQAFRARDFLEILKDLVDSVAEQ